MGEGRAEIDGPTSVLRACDHDTRHDQQVAGSRPALMCRDAPASAGPCRSDAGCVEKGTSVPALPCPLTRRRHRRSPMSALRMPSPRLPSFGTPKTCTAGWSVTTMGDRCHCATAYEMQTSNIQLDPFLSGISLAIVKPSRLRPPRSTTFDIPKQRENARSSAGLRRRVPAEVSIGGRRQCSRLA